MVEINGMNMKDIIIADGILDMLELQLYWDWHVNKVWPFWRRENTEVRELYRASPLSIEEAKEISDYWNTHITLAPIERKRLSILIIALSNEGMSVHGIMLLLKRVAEYLSKENVNNLLMPDMDIVPYDLSKC